MRGEDLTQLITQLAVEPVQSAGTTEIMTGKAVDVTRNPEPGPNTPLEKTALISFRIQVAPNIILDRDYFTPVGDIWVEEGTRFILIKKQGNGPFVALEEGAFK